MLNSCAGSNRTIATDAHISANHRMRPDDRREMETITDVYKNALVIMLTFQAASMTTMSPGLLVNLCAGLFILPFFLFSATAGQLADKYGTTAADQMLNGGNIAAQMPSATRARCAPASTTMRPSEPRANAIHNLRLDRWSGRGANVVPTGRPATASAMTPGTVADTLTCAYNDLAADRQSVAAVQALEAILDAHAKGEPDCVVRINDPKGGLVMYRPGVSEPTVLYSGRV